MFLQALNRKYKLKQHLKRLFNNSVIAITCLILIAIIVTVALGLSVCSARFPKFLGNSPENIARIKATTDPNEFTFVVVGDIKSGTATFEAMLDVIRGDKPAFVVVLGDFVCHPEFISHKLFAFEVAEFAKDFPIFLVPGNHDISTEGPFRLEDFENTYGSSHFCFTIDKCLFVFLDNVSQYGQRGHYLKFLEQAISNQKEDIRKIFVFMHIPPLGLNLSILHCGLPGSEEFLRLAKKYRIDYVFCGDHHGYVKTERDGTTFIVTGGGGAPLRGKHGRFHHLVRIEVRNDMDMITETVICTKKHLETAELMERNIAVYLWPLITRNSMSIAVSLVLFGTAITSLRFSFGWRKQLTKGDF